MEETAGERESAALARWLAERMRERGLGQRQLARFSGVSLGTISAILHGQGTPRAEIVEALAEYFGVDPLTVLPLAGLSALDAAPPEARAEAATLLRRLYALRPADRAAIIRRVNGILDFLERDDGGGESLPPAR